VKKDESGGQNDIEQQEKSAKAKKYRFGKDDYLAEGVCIGTLIGVFLGQLFSYYTFAGLIVGIVAGGFLGFLVKKKKKS